MSSEILINGNGGAASLVSAGTSTGVYPLTLWSDGSIAGSPFAGFNSPPVQYTAATSPVVDLIFSSPQNRITGLREWNQGGGDLGDNDGFASWDVTFYAPGLVSLGTYNMVMGNGGTPFTLTLPAELNNVERVRLSNMRKLSPGATVAPLVREVRALQSRPVFACRRNGAVQWYDTAGTLVPAAGLIICGNAA